MNARKEWWWWMATWFGSGLSPIVSGTVGSLAALPFAYAIQTFFGIFGNVALFLASLAIFAVGCKASQRFIDKSGKGSDPGEIVVDEVAGMWLTLSIADKPELMVYAVGFILFRFFDIVKPWPVSWADRKVKGGLGVMLDDMLAGVYAILALMMIRHVMVGYAG